MCESAFPTIPENHGYNQSYGTGSNPGMSLRDYFAAKALQGLLSDPNVTNFQSAVDNSYKIADMMIERRKIDKSCQ